MLLIKNQRIFHNIVTPLINRLNALISRLFLMNNRSSFIGDFFMSRLPHSLLTLTSARSDYEKPRS